MPAERAKPNLTLRVGVAATIGIIVQILVLALLTGCRPANILPEFLLVPPSVGPTLCVVLALGRSGVHFPGTPGLPIVLALGSWHAALICCGLFEPIGGGGALVMCVAGTIPIAAAVSSLVRRWDWGYVFWMLGAGAAVGGATTVTIDPPVLGLLTTVFWTTAIGFIAGLWRTRASALGVRT